MAEEKNQEQNLSQLLQIRRDKLKELQGGGRDPFQITKYEVTHDTVSYTHLDVYKRQVRDCPEAVRPPQYPGVPAGEDQEAHRPGPAGVR